MTAYVLTTEGRRELLSELERLATRFGAVNVLTIAAQMVDDEDARHLNDPVRGEDW
jgi:hypothetical protein